MKYLGSKRRIARYILPIILKNREENQWYVEPFCGGCNSLDSVVNPRMGNDLNIFLIALLKRMQMPAPFKMPVVGERMYKQIQQNQQAYPKWMVGYVGFSLSFGAKFFGGYRRDKIGLRDYEDEALRNTQAQQIKLSGIRFTAGSYLDMAIPIKSIIYCDPPYRDTTGYLTGSFDYDQFYAWCTRKNQEGHSVFISEHAMPATAFTCVWEREIALSLDHKNRVKQRVERLFVPKQ